jgi:hypothetical protein
MRSHFLWAGLVAGLLAAPGCAPSQSAATPRNTLVLGIDVSGSFKGSYNDAVEFAAYYIYGHLNGLGGLRAPTALFVADIGGQTAGEVKPFHPIQDFQEKSVQQIAADLRVWFPSQDVLTDFNVFFDRAATMIKRQNLVLAPLNIVLLSDGLPDVPGVRSSDTLTPFVRLDLSPLEYVSRSVTIRLLYPTPTVDTRWERRVKRNRVRLWTVDGAVMAGWRRQLAEGEPPEAQQRLWAWINDNVDFRVRARIL